MLVSIVAPAAHPIKDKILVPRVISKLHRDMCLKAASGCSSKLIIIIPLKDVPEQHVALL